MGWISGLGRSPGGGNNKTTPIFLPEKSHGQRSLEGYSPKGRRESDMTEHSIVLIVTGPHAGLFRCPVLHSFIKYKDSYIDVFMY